MRIWIFVTSLCLASSACGDDAQPPPDDGTLAPYQSVFVNSCVASACHQGDPPVGAPMSLEPELAHQNLVGVPTVSYCRPSGIRVVAGDLAASCLWELLLNDTMPINAPPLSAEDKEIVRAWIADGAPP